MSMEDGMLKVILDSEGYLIAAGELQFKTLKERRELGDMMAKGYVMKTMHIDEYRASNFTWAWNKPEIKQS